MSKFCLRSWQVPTLSAIGAPLLASPVCKFGQVSVAQVRHTCGEKHAPAGVACLQVWPSFGCPGVAKASQYWCPHLARLCRRRFAQLFQQGLFCILPALGGVAGVHVWQGSGRLGWAKVSQFWLAASLVPLPRATAEGVASGQDWYCGGVYGQVWQSLGAQSFVIRSLMRSCQCATCSASGAPLPASPVCRCGKVSLAQIWQRHCILILAGRVEWATLAKSGERSFPLDFSRCLRFAKLHLAGALALFWLVGRSGKVW